MTPVRTESSSHSLSLALHSSLNVEKKKKKKKHRMHKKEKQIEQQQQHIDENNSTTARSIDQQLSRSRDLDAFFLRRVEFVRYTRPDARQDALHRKYKPINAADTITTTTKSNHNSSTMSKIEGLTYHHSHNHTVETNGVDSASQLDRGEALVLPKRGIFPENRLSLTWRNVQSIGPGLFNLGNTCFLNSVLQCLTYTPSLAQYILESGHGRTCKWLIY
jgi:ubiquitin carboxyl-terminal hydrolase 36/42